MAVRCQYVPRMQIAILARASRKARAALEEWEKLQMDGRVGVILYFPDQDTYTLACADAITLNGRR